MNNSYPDDESSDDKWNQPEADYKHYLAFDFSKVRRMPFSWRHTIHVTHKSQKHLQSNTKIDFVTFSLDIEWLLTLTFRRPWLFNHAWVEYKHKIES